MKVSINSAVWFCIRTLVFTTFLPLMLKNNEPLMRALSKLINENEPELVLFVGEALVGNDGVNQLQMFNQVRHISS